VIARAAILCLLSLAVFGQQVDLTAARRLYQTTRYEEAVKVLENQKDPDSQQLLGQSLFMLGQFKKATEVFDRAAISRPDSSDLQLWLGRAYGRRAETSNPLFAPRYASKARQHFEKSVQLNPRNILAMNDLFEYYMQAPGFLGGGKDKAAALAQKISEVDKAEGHFATARLAEDSRELSAAEGQLRRAIEAAPTQVGRVIDLARFLARHGRHKESESEFQRAEKIAPNNPRLLFERAATYIEAKRNLDQSKLLLKKYLEAPLTPDDPSRQEAEKLLRSTGS
jgi:Flp pilus assembly protein TadD